jgi:CubicO group peptidase (beta-lactamase class C family)
VKQAASFPALATVALCCVAYCQTLSTGTAASRAEGVERNLTGMYFLQGARPEHATLLQRMAELQVPGVTIAAIHDGKIDWARGYGVAATGGPAVTPATLFSAESMSKPVTALAVLKLYEQGRIDLDHNVNDYLKRWKLPESSLPGPKTVTVRQLLTHTSGIGTHNGWLYDTSNPLPTLLNDLDGATPSRTAAVRIESAPGVKFQYANGGYEVLELLVEDVSGESFGSFVSESVLRPAGMTDSHYDVPVSDQLSAKAATAYLNGHASPPRMYYNSNFAAGGLWSTATDMATLLIELQREYDGQSSRILKQSTVRQMLLPGPQVMPGMFQGLGFEIGGKPGAHFMEHGGSGVFQDEMVAYFQGRRDGLVVMANGSNGGILVKEVLRSAATTYDWPDYRSQSHPFLPMDASAVRKYVGDFGPLRF